MCQADRTYNGPLEGVNSRIKNDPSGRGECGDLELLNAYHALTVGDLAR